MQAGAEGFAGAPGSLEPVVAALVSAPHDDRLPAGVGFSVPMLVPGAMLAWSVWMALALLLEARWLEPSSKWQAISRRNPVDEARGETRSFP